MTTELSEEDVDRIATSVVTKLVTNKKFVIDEEIHYNDHKQLELFLKTWSEAKGIWMKIILSAILLGGVILAGIGLYRHGN